MLIDRVKWMGSVRLDKYWEGAASPFEVIHASNLLLTAGATAMWQKLAGQGAVTSYDAANAYLCAGTSNAAPAVGQTDMQGATKFRKIVDAAPTISGNGIVFVSTFGATEANFAWEEVGIANHATAGILLNRVAQTFGTKAVGMQWVLTGTVTLI